MLIKKEQKPIIRSLFDTDTYKLTMQQANFFKYPDVDVEYELNNRDKTYMPPGFGERYQEEIYKMKGLRIPDGGLEWLKGVLPVFKKEYLEYLGDYRFNPDEISVIQTNAPEDNIHIKAKGKAPSSIPWEVPCLGLFELYYQMTGNKGDWSHFTKSTTEKIRLWSEAKIKLIEMGTRRRYSYDAQDYAVGRFAREYPHLLGTSNVHLAYKYGIKPKGTVAHEWPMLHQVLFGTAQANIKALETWREIYGNLLSIVLPDAFTTDFFLKTFTKEWAEWADGGRQDSYDPNIFAKKWIQHYLNLGIDPKTKLVFFSDSLDLWKPIELQKRWSPEIGTGFGIGTFITNDFGIKPLNIVMKLTKVNGQPAVKIPDTPGKRNGDPARAEEVAQEIAELMKN